ncbi:ATP-binding protein [Enterovirga rhinocerotis]|uniref:Novel STAND NTPase 1 domain-containing protein n=1 Tax=Enterovirga rhinocerotis TaxID=1339210 RepID=A0A4V3DYK9_9HYPH|nr:ATP-binding protein [Enterovirga rhinocerotis]TDR93009.1 hypothetical protein EV668_0256 [Enterovirga rhinocerotis]
MTVAIPKLRIFVSSPGDVGAERAVAVAVTERLQLEFRGQVELETYLWERTVLRATDSFQAQIIDIQDADLAIFILWSRIGTPLAIEQFKRQDGTQYGSGTEYEFERAREGFVAKGRPDLLCYLKTDEIRFSLKDREERQRRNAELDSVGSFIDRWFRNPDGTFKSAFYSFEKTAAFEELVEIHLRDWIRERLRELQADASSRTVWKGSPFRGLQAFDYEHSLIYCGRTAMVAEALETLRRRAAAGRAFLMVTGMSGVGKSSLVRAGIVPLLIRPSVIEGVIGWRRATFKPSVGTQTLLEGFGAALLAADALPDLAAPEQIEPLLRDQAALTNAVIRALDLATQKARQARPDPDTEGTVRLVVVFDQCEEIFDEKVPIADRDAFAEALRTLVLTGRVWIIATLRADFFSRTGDLPERFRELFIERDGLFTVGGPRTAEIAQMIRRPAMMAGLAFEKRGDPEEGLDEVLRDAAAGNPTVLPLLEFTLDELFRRSGGTGLLRFSDYEQIGGLHGALRLRAEEEFEKLSPAVQASLPQVLAAMVHTDPTDDRLLLQNRVPLSQFDSLPECRRLIDAFVAAHLFVGDQAPDGSPVVALAHEALLREWPPAVLWIEANRESLRLRSGIAAAAALWRTSDRRESRLLSGELLKDATRLLRTNATMLGPDERAFVQASAELDRKRRMKTVRRAALAAAAVLVMVLIPTLGLRQIQHGVATAWAIPRLWNADRVLPVSPEAKANLHRSIETITQIVRRDADEHPELGPWSMAQMRAALHGTPGNAAQAGRDLRAYMTGLRDPSCFCWKETAQRLPNHFASAWVLLSFALHEEKATPEELDAVLARQSGAGWWGIYHLVETDRNAAAGVTALTLHALQHHLDRGLVPPEQQDRVKTAIAKGVAWLLSQKQPDAARWPPYPLPPVGIFEKGEYPGLSAFVIHILREVTGERGFDRPWLDALPITVPQFRDNEISKANLLVKAGASVEVDDSRFYRFPWMLLATVETQESGSLLQRARALVWVEQALKAPLSNADFGNEAWIAGEVLFVLRQVEARLEGKPAFADRPAAAAAIGPDRYGKSPPAQ